MLVVSVVKEMVAKVAVLHLAALANITEVTDFSKQVVIGLAERKEFKSLIRFR